MNAFRRAVCEGCKYVGARKLVPIRTIRGARVRLCARCSNLYLTKTRAVIDATRLSTLYSIANIYRSILDWHDDEEMYRDLDFEELWRDKYRELQELEEHEMQPPPSTPPRPIVNRNVQCLAPKKKKIQD
jgi:hypothetical protein